MSNNLNCLSPQIKQLQRLRVLDARFNQIKDLPVEICFLPCLEELYLSNNCLVSLPHAISQLTQLRRLDIRSNQIAVLPLDLVALTNLRDLLIDKNPIGNVPQGLHYAEARVILQHLRHTITAPSDLESRTSSSSIDTHAHPRRYAVLALSVKLSLHVSDHYFYSLRVCCYLCILCVHPSQRVCFQYSDRQRSRSLCCCCCCGCRQTRYQWRGCTGCCHITTHRATFIVIHHRTA